MKVLLILLAAVAGLLLLEVLPDAFRHTVHAFREGTLLLLPTGAILLTTVSLVLGVERWAQRITGYRVPPERRIMIPVPALLALAYFFNAITLPFYAEIPGYWDAAVILSLAILPFWLLEQMRTPLPFILGVWFLHIVWFLVVVTINAKILRGHWLDALMGGH